MPGRDCKRKILSLMKIGLTLDSLLSVWGSNQVTTTWKAGFDSDLTAKKTATYSQTSTFLACDHNYPTFAPEKVVFLLTDSTVALPTVTDSTLGEINVSSCVKTKLHIGSDTSSVVV